MKTMMHKSLSVELALMNWEIHEFAHIMKGKSGKWLTPEECKMAFIKRLAKGEKYLPFGPPCEGFDPDIGCVGHIE